MKLPGGIQTYFNPSFELSVTVLALMPDGSEDCWLEKRCGSEVHETAKNHKIIIARIRKLTPLRMVSNILGVDDEVGPSRREKQYSKGN